MKVSCGWAGSKGGAERGVEEDQRGARHSEREIIDNLLVRIHLIIWMVSVDRHCNMGV